jgi:hypothetical protein
MGGILVGWEEAWAGATMIMAAAAGNERIWGGTVSQIGEEIGCRGTQNLAKYIYSLS